MSAAEYSLIDRVRKTRNTAPLVSWLRIWTEEKINFEEEPDFEVRRPVLDATLACLLADILDGTLKATYKRPVRADWDPSDLRGVIEFERRLLASGNPRTVEKAKRLGYTLDDISDGRKQRTIARHFVADAFRVSLRTLDDRLNPRAGRRKRG